MIFNIPKVLFLQAIANIKLIFTCVLFNDHDWTSDAEQGMPPTKEMLDMGLVGFKVYSQMYCKRCGKKEHLEVFK